MTDTKKDDRIRDANALRRQISSLDEVNAEDRILFVHDRLMSAIEDICEKHKGEAQESVFSNRQISVLKDISYQIVHILDGRNEVRRSFLGVQFKKFREADIHKQIGIIATLLGGIYFAITGLPTLSEWYKRIHITVDEAPKKEDPKQQPPN